MRWLDRLLLACAAVVVTVNLLPLGARWSWMLELTAHFRVQYLAVTGTVLLLVALRRKWPACAALILAGAVSAWPVLPYVAFPAPSASAEPTRVKVLTVNVSYRQFSVRRLLEIVREAKQFNAREFRILAAQSVIDMFLDEESQSLAQLGDFIGKPISLQVETVYTQEQYDIVLI